MSDAGDEALTMIAFVGSVFSPYYAWRGRHAPDDHCALNVALYGSRVKRWTMTERPERAVRRDASSFEIGPSRLAWHGDALIADINELAAPIPYRVRGRIVIHPETIAQEVVELDRTGQHIWRPLAPRARVELVMSEPQLRWAGWGYLDANIGLAPLEHGFRRWDWSRATTDAGSVVLYHVEPIDGGDDSIALWFGRDGNIEEFVPPSDMILPSTFWRVPRRIQADAGSSPVVVRTLEDTPFYARSIIDTIVMGRKTRSMHESLSLTRFGSPIVKAMLPFRMPRAFWHR